MRLTSKPTYYSLLATALISFSIQLFATALIRNVYYSQHLFFSTALFSNRSLFSTARYRPADGLVSFRSKSMKDVYAGPVLVGDGGSNRNRFVRTVKKKKRQTTR